MQDRHSQRSHISSQPYMFMEANVVTVTTQLLIRLTNIDINKLLNLWLVQFDGLVAFIGRIGIAKGPTGNYFSDVEPRYKTTLEKF